MQVNFSELFEHSDPNGDTLKVVRIGKMEGLVFTIQHQGADTGVSAAIDYHGMKVLRDTLTEQLKTMADKIIAEAIKNADNPNNEWKM